MSRRQTGAEVTDRLCRVLTFTQLTGSWQTKKSPAGERNISEKLQSCCHHLKITPCVLEGVLLVFFPPLAGR